MIRINIISVCMCVYEYVCVCVCLCEQGRYVYNIINMVLCVYVCVCMCVCVWGYIAFIYFSPQGQNKDQLYRELPSSKRQGPNIMPKKSAKKTFIEFFMPFHQVREETMEYKSYWYPNTIFDLSASNLGYFSTNILIYRWDNYVYHHWECASIYCPLSFPLSKLIIF